MCTVTAKIKIGFGVFCQSNQKKHKMTGMPNLDLLRNLGSVLSFWPNSMKKHLLLELYETKQNFVKWCRYLCLLEQLPVLFMSHGPYNAPVDV